MEPVDVVVGGGEHEHLTISVLGYEFPEGGDAFEGGWLRATLTAETRGFRGSLVNDPCLTVFELVRWRKDLQRLHRTLRGVAVLDPTEPYLQVSARSSGRGAIALEVVLRGQADAQGPELRFHLDLDQTYLPGIIAGLLAVESAFPPQRS
jgi:hypothetical protein